MAATGFDEIIGFVRPILGDNDPQNLLYSSDAIDQHIRLAIITHNLPSVQESTPSSRTFTEELSTLNKALLSYRVAKSILSPQNSYFSYKTPVLTVTRNGGVNQLMAFINQTLDRLNGGFLALQEDNELWAIVNAPDRWAKDWSDMPSQTTV